MRRKFDDGTSLILRTKFYYRESSKGGRISLTEKEALLWKRKFYHEKEAISWKGKFYHARKFYCGFFKRL